MTQEPEVSPGWILALMTINFLGVWSSLLTAGITDT